MLCAKTPSRPELVKSMIYRQPSGDPLIVAEEDTCRSVPLSSTVPFGGDVIDPFFETVQLSLEVMVHTCYLLRASKFRFGFRSHDMVILSSFAAL